MTLQIWLLPIAILVVTTILAFPLSRYLTWIMNGKYKAPRFFHWFEARLDSGPQNWKQYTVSILLFNTVLFGFGFAILALQPWLPLNPDGKGMIAPTTIFHSVVSFMTNTDLQHYSGDQVFSNFSQIFFCLTNFFLSASIGFCGLTAIIRAFRGDSHVGNFFVDMWRVVVYMFLPIAFLLGIVFLQQGSPMTYQSSYHVNTLEPAAMGTTDKGARSASPPAALSLLRLRPCRGRRGNRQIPARADRQEQRENLAIVEIVFVPTRAQRRDHHRERAMQHKTALAFPRQGPARGTPEIEQHLTQKPQVCDERRHAALRRVLQVDVVQVHVCAGGQGARDIGGNVSQELRLHLLRTESKPRVRFDHFPAGAAADHAELVGIQIARRLVYRHHTVAHTHRVQPRQQHHGKRRQN